MQTRYKQKISGIIDMALDKQKEKDTNKKSMKKEVKATPNSKKIQQPKIQSIPTQSVKSKSDLLQQRLKMLKKKKQQADNKAIEETKKNEMVAEVIEPPFVEKTKKQVEKNVSQIIQHGEQKQIEKEGNQQGVVDTKQKPKQHSQQQQQKTVQDELRSKQEGYSKDENRLQQKQFQDKIAQSTQNNIEMQKQELDGRQHQHIVNNSHQNQIAPSENQEHAGQQLRIETMPSQQQQSDQNKMKLQQYLQKLRNKKSNQSEQKKKQVTAEAKKEEQTLKSKQKAQQEKDKSNFSPMEAQIFDVLNLKEEADNKQVEPDSEMKDQKEQKRRQVIATKSVEKNDVKQKLEKIKQKQQQLRKQKERIRQMQIQEQVAKQRERETKMLALAQLQRKQQDRMKQKVKEETIKKFHQQLQQKQKLREMQNNAGKMEEQNTQKQKQKQRHQQQQQQQQHEHEHQQEEQRKIRQQESAPNEKVQQEWIVEGPLEQNDIIEEQQPEQQTQRAKEQTSQLYDWWSHPIIGKRQKQIEESGDKAERIRSKIVLKQLYQLRYLMNDIQKNLQPPSGQANAQPKQIMKTTALKLLLLQAKLKNVS